MSCHKLLNLLAKRAVITVALFYRFEKDMIAANLIISQLELAFILYKQDRNAHRNKVDASFEKLEEFVESVVKPSPDLIDTEQLRQRRRKAISDAFASIQVTEKEANEAVIGFVSRATTRQWLVDNPDDQIREANRNLRTRLMQIITRRNLNMQSARDTPSISELVNVLETNGVIPRGGERRSRESADIITRIGDRVDRGERITSDEFQHGDYTLATAWFDSILPDMEE